MRKELEATPTTLEEANRLLIIAKEEIVSNESIIKKNEESIATLTKERDTAQEASRKNFDAFVNAAGESRRREEVDSGERNKDPLKVDDIKITPRV